MAGNTSQGATRVEKETLSLFKGKAVVHFRPSDDYKGEFGFDWLRVKDNGLAKEPDYENIIVSGYKNGAVDYTKAEAYEALKKEYEKIPVFLFDEYRVPYLNLFSKTYSDTVAINPKPPYEATLKVLVEIKTADVDEIKFEFNSKIFSINDKDEFSLDDKAVCAFKESVNKTIKITCKKDITTYKDGEIMVYAYPKTQAGEDRDKKRKLAGKIIVGKNDKTVRKEVKFVFVRVKTNVDGTIIKIGAFAKENINEQIRVRNTLYQGLFRALIWVKRKNRNNGLYEYIDLDLRDDAAFWKGGTHIINAATGRTNPNGVYIDAATGYIDSNRTGVDGKRIFTYLKDKFMSDTANSAYSEHIPIFAFGENNDFFGEAESIGGLKSVILFDNRLSVDNSTAAHEILHCFGLRHTFREENPINDYRQKYIFKEEKGDDATDNIMTYNDTHMITTWHWQWKIIRKHI